MASSTAALTLQLVSTVIVPSMSGGVIAGCSPSQGVFAVSGAVSSGDLSAELPAPMPLTESRGVV